MGKHPAKDWPARWIFDDHSDKSTEFQILDLLHDIRLLIYFLLWAVILF